MPNEIGNNVVNPPQSDSGAGPLVLIIIVAFLIAAILYFLGYLDFLDFSVKSSETITPTSTSTSTPTPTSAPVVQKVIVKGQLIGDAIYGGGCNVYTVDSDINVAAVHAGLVAVGETKEINLIQIPNYSSFSSINRNGIVSDEFLNIDNAIQIWTDVKPDLSCKETNVSTSGKILVTGKLSSTEAIYGGKCGIYTDDSDLDLAATQTGLVQPGQTTVISFSRIDNYPTFESITKNGITSDESLVAQTGIQLWNSPQQPVLSSIPCQEASSTGPTKVTVIGSEDGNIYGGMCNIYTADSDLGTAAVHAGLVQVGQIKTINFIQKPNIQQFPAITKNNISSMEFLEPDDAIQIWSDDIPLASGC